MYYIFAFKSRSEALKLYDKSKRVIKVALISTPQSVSGGCSLSIRCEERDFYTLSSIFTSLNFSSFIGAYCIYNTNGVITTKKVLN